MRAVEELATTGARVLAAVRTELLLAMPFLASALDILPCVMDRRIPVFGTDSACLRYQPVPLLRMYVESSQSLNRLYMHSLIHCLLRHPEGPPALRTNGAGKRFPEDMDVSRQRSLMLWDLASDIAVEALIDRMEVPAVARVTSELRLDLIERLTGECGVLTAQRIYSWLSEHTPDTD